MDGDIFLSTMQTLTVAVNIVGVMGKGLALTTKQQFPDVYDKYRAVCKDKTLLIGKPCLYARDIPFDPASTDDMKWFLLFATKNHWRENSKLEYIEQGLQYLVEHVTTQKIKSLALPALGCGLGNLSWADVGPLMCHYLQQLDIPIAIYLPREQEVPNDQIMPEFLLPD